MPRPCWALIPSPAAIKTFKDKAFFARYATEQGLGPYLPAHYDVTAPRFPAVLKRTNLNAGDGIAIVETEAELAERLSEDPWAGNPVVLQEVIAGDAEEVAHLVCVDGRILWWAGFAYPLNSPREIRKVSQTSEMVRVTLSEEDIAVFERFLMPVAFDGPAAVNYKRREDGRIAIFEFNARFGGSLMRPQHIDDLEGALRVVLAEAKWHEAVG
jgi:carbamoylphosphate synthase large subunit